MTVYHPETTEQVCEVVAWAAAAPVPLRVHGGSALCRLGRPVIAEHDLVLSTLRGILLYEPEELVLAAAAGSRVVEIEARLARNNQMLAFEPPDLGPLLGAPAGQATLGDIVDANLSGPRRVKAGAVRDHILGVKVVTGRGEVIKAGGRVVKNVTGYDLPKLMTGAFGTLSVLTEITVKAVPAAPETNTLVVTGLDAPAAVRALTTALQTPHDVSAAAYLPAAVAQRSSVDSLAAAGESATLVRVEGFGPSVAARSAALRAILESAGSVQALETDDSKRVWREVRDVALLTTDQDALVWRISVPPAAGAEVLAAIGAALPKSVESFLDWGGGLIWLAVPADTPGAGARPIRAAFAPFGGHATLVRAPDSVRMVEEVFQPTSAALAALTDRIKTQFDPSHVLNPGRVRATASEIPA